MKSTQTKNGGPRSLKTSATTHTTRKTTGKRRAKSLAKDRLLARSKVDIHAFLRERMATEYKFHTERNWKFDYAEGLMDYFKRTPYGMGLPKVAIEIEGGIFNKGRHTRSLGYLGDMEKYNEAARAGWLVFRYAPWQFDLMIEQIGPMMGWTK